jgi:hypothetical protein
VHLTSGTRVVPDGAHDASATSDDDRTN